jgi:hypothetical protein
VPRRSLVTVALAAAGSAAAVVYRRRSAQREHVDLTLADGTRVSLHEGAGDLLAIAHELQHA